MYRVPGMEAGTYAHYDITVQGSTYAIRSRPGVFSWHDLDPAYGHAVGCAGGAPLG